MYDEIKKDFRNILEKSRDLGLEISITEIMDFLSDSPDIMCVCFEFLEECFNKKQVIENRKIGQRNTITFEVNANYDKKFYCAAKLADNAKNITFDDEKSVYYVTFKATDIVNISLMYYNLTGFFNEHYSDLILAFDFLKKHYFWAYLEDCIISFLYTNRTKYGSLIYKFEFVFEKLRTAIQTYHKTKLDYVYAIIKKENRVPSKWSHEYKLYSIIKRYIPDAQFQYKCDWLGKQTFDIFLPSTNVAIEYQGEQHYKPLAFFGGEEGLREVKRRDEQKKVLAEINKVTLLYWSYIYYVSNYSVKSFLERNNIDIPKTIKNNNAINMAPTLK